MKKSLYVVLASPCEKNTYKVLGYIEVKRYPMVLLEVTDYQHVIVGSRIPTSVNVTTEMLIEVAKDFWNNPDVLCLEEVEE